MMMPSMSTDETVMEMETMNGMPEGRTERRKRSNLEYSEVSLKDYELLFFRLKIIMFALRR